MMKRLLAPLAVLVVVCCSTGVWGANSVVVESRAMATNAVDCPIHIKFENDVSLIGMAVPLVIREVTPGTYISALRLSWDERIFPGGPMAGIMVNQQRAVPNGTCRPGGFTAVSYASDTLKHAVPASPVCAMFAAVDIIGVPLPPGADVTGSMILWADVIGPEGTFEIDTTCADPTNHLLYVSGGGPYVTPAFTKGIFTTHANTAPTALCRNVVVTTGPSCLANASINNGSFDADGDPITVTQTPPGPYPIGQTLVQLVVTDINCVSDTCSNIVTVRDGTPPVITCPSDTVVMVGPGEGGMIVEFEASATDECTAVSVVCTPPSGSVFPVGVSEVTCIATDGSQNADTCTFLVAVGSSGYCNDRPEDVNCDGVLDVFDMNQIIEALFMGAPESGPCCSVKK